jgi:hypothetical protein
MASVSRFPNQPNPRDSWPAWVDTHTWELSEPEPTAHGSESIAIGTLAQLCPGVPEDDRGAIYVQHTIDGEIVTFKPFATVQEARTFARQLWGDGGHVAGESSPFDIELVTTSVLEHWLAESCPDPEPLGDGSWTLPPSGGID